MLLAYSCLISGCTTKLPYMEPEEIEQRLEGIWQVFWLGLQN
jgi:hypothetical protein